MTILTPKTHSPRSVPFAIASQLALELALEMAEAEGETCIGVVEMALPTGRSVVAVGEEAPEAGELTWYEIRTNGPGYSGWIARDATNRYTTEMLVGDLG